MVADSILPLEVAERVIDFLAILDFPSVSSCSIVCWAFLARCRGHLFANVAPEPFNIVKFVNVILYTPSIATYIRHLVFLISNAYGEWDDLAQCLLQITRLEHLDLSVLPDQKYAGFSWRFQFNNGTESALGAGLGHLLSLPTLRRLSMTGNIIDVPVSLLRGLKNLKALELDNVVLIYDEEPSDLVGGEFKQPIALEKLFIGRRACSTAQRVLPARMGKGNQEIPPVIEFKNLKSVDFTYSSEGNIFRPKAFFESQRLHRAGFSFTHSWRHLLVH